MKFLFSLLFIALLVNASTVDKKIKSTTSAINSTKNQYSSIASKMEANAKEILDQTVTIQKQQIKLNELEQALGLKATIYKTNIVELGTLSKTQAKLKKDQEDTEQKLIFNIARMASLTILIDDKQGNANLDSIMSEEIIKQLAKQTNQNIKELNTKFFQTSEQMSTLEKKSIQIKTEISSIDQKRKELKDAKSENEKELVKLQINKDKYKLALEKILKQQDSLKQTLANLNIIQIDEKRRAEEKARQKQAINNHVTTNNTTQEPINNTNTTTSKDKVKKYGSSYQSLETVRYSGEKTIAPLEGYRVTKRYGNYTDPIYNIKIFNESVSLSPNQKGEKVRNVFNGKVIFAKNTPLLDNVIIVEHDNGLHTIYANLSQIAPGIQKGSKIIKGSVIGRVNDELVFEVTQRDSHIDPLELF
jgi:murein DD-endopeptidase MepM/ murein hydrolase activator NlpD